MKSWKRLIYYLMLNVLVSACTTFAVLVIWDQTHGTTTGGLFSFGSLFSSSPNPVPAAAGSETAELAADPAPTPTYETYQVQEGDDFAGIAAKYGVPEEQLILINGFTQAQPLGVGEVLLIPVAPGSARAPDVEVVSVIAAGDLDSERVVLRQHGSGELLLAGWQLQTKDGNTFTFPALELAKDGFEIEVYTKAGTNRADELYWGLSEPVWSSGETVLLLNAYGELQVSYQIP